MDLLNLLHRALSYHLAPVLARTGTDIDNLVRSIHGFLIVLHHQQSIAQIAQMLERFQKLAIITLVQADAGLIEDIEHAG